jgi:hypothetical protein
MVAEPIHTGLLAIHSAVGYPYPKTRKVRGLPMKRLAIVLCAAIATPTLAFGGPADGINRLKAVSTLKADQANDDAMKSNPPPPPPPPSQKFNAKGKHIPSAIITQRKARKASGTQTYQIKMSAPLITNTAPKPTPPRPTLGTTSNTLPPRR